MNVLFLTHRVPFAPNRGDRVRAFHTVRVLASRADVEVLSLAHDRDEAAAVDGVRALGVRAEACLIPHTWNRLKALPQLAGARPLTHMLLQSPAWAAQLRASVAAHPPDVVLAYCSGMARFAMEPPLDRCPFVLDMVDVDSEKWAELSRTAGGPMRWVYAREARCLGAFERVAVERAAATTVINEREQTLLKERTGREAVVLPSGVDLGGLAPHRAPADSRDIVFCGVMDYAPNVEGVLWFAREIWPLVRAAQPHARFVVVGLNPLPVVRQLASESSGIVVTGSVPDVKPYLWNAALSVAPLRTARGLQNKVLEALAAGVPSVVTSNVFAGLPAEAHAGCRVADQPAAFAAHVLECLGLTPEQRRARAAAANLGQLSWDVRLAPLYDLLESACRGKRDA